MRCLVLRSLLGLLTIFSLTRVGNADALEVTLSEGDVVPMFEAKAADGMVWRSEVQLFAEVNSLIPNTIAGISWKQLDDWPLNQNNHPSDSQQFLGTDAFWIESIVLRHLELLAVSFVK